MDQHSAGVFHPRERSYVGCAQRGEGECVDHGACEPDTAYSGSGSVGQAMASEVQRFDINYYAQKRVIGRLKRIFEIEMRAAFTEKTS